MGAQGRSRPKIVVIGAGSADFGTDCLAGIFRTPGLHGSTLALVDIDREKLDLAERIARKLNDVTGADIEISATPSRSEALPGADFVVLAVTIDREQTWSRDHEVALRHGITHYAENGGPGAFAHAWRNLGLVLPIARDVERLCPAAHVLALTNPLTRICSALNTLTRLRFVGVCHGSGSGTGLPSSFEPLTRRLAALFGLIPVQSDTHVSEYLPFTSHPDTWARYDIQLYDFTWAQQRRIRHQRALRSMADGVTAVDTLLGADSERVEFVIDAIANDAGGYEEALNVRNRGYIENLPWGAVVEVPCTVDANGVRGVHVGSLPEPIAALCRTQLTIADMNVRAFVTGDRSLVHQLLAIDPMIRDLDTAAELADEYLQLNDGYVQMG